MNLNWSHIIESKQVSKEALALLEGYLIEHPYSSLLQSLVAKGYLEHVPSKAQEQLKHAAIRIRERKKLYDLLYADVEAPEFNQNVIDSQPDESAVDAAVPEFLDETEEKPVSEEKAEDQKIAEFDRQLAAAALSSGIAIKLLEEEEEPSKELPNNTKNESNDAVSGLSPEATEFESTESKPREKMNFSSWMESLNDSSDSSNKEEPAPAVNKIHLKETMQIVDHFIENEESLVPKRAEFFSPAKAAKNSLTDNDEIVTETLAKIYAEQGSYLKAISTYEKLSLRHPEKSAYFAALIEKLKKEI
jgi:hypothetical protein